MENFNGSNGGNVCGDDIGLQSSPTVIDPKTIESTHSQAQPLHKMDQSMESVQHAVSAQAPLPNHNNNSAANTDHKVSAKSPVPLTNKEKLLVMQRQDLQIRMQQQESFARPKKLTKAEVPTKSMKRQIPEAWSNQRSKESCEASQLENEELQENIKNLGKCLCCQSYGRPCLQREASLMTDEARQRYYLDMKRRREVSVQEKVLKGDTQEQDSIPSMNLDEWSITVTEFQPRTNKRSKVQNNIASQDKKMSVSTTENGTQSNLDQAVGSEAQDILNREMVQRQHNHHTRKDPTAHVVPLVVTVEQEEGQNGQRKKNDAVQCCEHSTLGYHTKSCPNRSLCPFCGKKARPGDRCSRKECRKKRRVALVQGRRYNYGETSHHMSQSLKKGVPTEVEIQEQYDEDTRNELDEQRNSRARTLRRDKGTHTMGAPGRSQDGCIIGRCFKCEEVGHYAHKCPMLSTKGWLCLLCGEVGHLASWCDKQTDDQPEESN